MSEAEEADAEEQARQEAVAKLRAELDARISELPNGDLVVELLEPVKSADGGTRGRILVRRATLASWRIYDRTGDFHAFLDALCESKDHLAITNLRDAWALERAGARQREKFQGSGA